MIKQLQLFDWGLNRKYAKPIYNFFSGKTQSFLQVPAKTTYIQINLVR